MEKVLEIAEIAEIVEAGCIAEWHSADRKSNHDGEPTGGNVLELWELST